MMLKTYFMVKFTFVREPFERLLSAYLDKFFLSKKQGSSIASTAWSINLEGLSAECYRTEFTELKDITFREFIEYIVTNGSNITISVMDYIIM